MTFNMFEVQEMVKYGSLIFVTTGTNFNKIESSELMNLGKREVLNLATGRASVQKIYREKGGAKRILVKVHLS